jgi:hypothetical protein
MNTSALKEASEFLESYACDIDSDYASDLGASVLFLVDNFSLPTFVKRVILIQAIQKLNAIGDSEEDGKYLDCAELLEEELKGYSERTTSTRPHS